MNDRTRRHFLADVGRGMLAASVGSAVAADLGLTPPAFADGDTPRLTFGALEPLAALLQETPPDALLRDVAAKLKAGTDLRSLVAAGALANARAFGGDDYHGFHIFMALAPAYAMAQELPEAQKPLPILKVLYRNAERLHKNRAVGRSGPAADRLRPVTAEKMPPGADPAGKLQEVTRGNNYHRGEALMAGFVEASPQDAFDHLQTSVNDEADVHRVVLAWRAWATLDLTGKEHATTLLRQSVRYCASAKDDQEMGQSYRHRPSAVRQTLPQLLDQYKLVGKPLGKRRADDDWVAKLSSTILRGTPAEAAEAAAAALAEGFHREDVGEAIALATNAMLLRDQGQHNQSGSKSVGSVHGDSQGVHAADAANAWRNIARVSPPRNAIAALIVAAYHTGGPAKGLLDSPHPTRDAIARVKGKDAATLLRELDGAIRERNQAQACALTHCYGYLGFADRPLFDLLLKYAISEDGALHAEKFYRTAVEEYATSRPAFRWRHLIGLARVTASAFGWPARGYNEAKRLLGV